MQYKNAYGDDVKFYAWVRPRNFEKFCNDYWSTENWTNGSWLGVGHVSVVDKCFDLVKVEFLNTDAVKVLGSYGKVEIHSYSPSDGIFHDIKSLDDISERISRGVEFENKWGFNKK